MALKEEGTEFGGYFVVNGIERVVRMLIQPRRHYIMALRRSAYRKRGSSYTDMATVLRCAPLACDRSRRPSAGFSRTSTVQLTAALLLGCLPCSQLQHCSSCKLGWPCVALQPAGSRPACPPSSPAPRQTWLGLQVRAA